VQKALPSSPPPIQSSHAPSKRQESSTYKQPYQYHLILHE
jgi:hypothetical protein